MGAPSKLRNAGRTGSQGTWRNEGAPQPAAAAGGDPRQVSALPTQLELGCHPRVLLSTDAAAAHFGRSALTDEWSAFLSGYFPGEATFVTFTYSDKGAARFLPYRPAAVFGDLQRFFTKLGYQGPAFFVCESHQWRDALHAHGLIHGLTAGERVQLQEAWYAQRGRARLLPATAGAFPYVCKYALKYSDQRGDFVELCHLPSFTPAGKRS